MSAYILFLIILKFLEFLVRNSIEIRNFNILEKIQNFEAIENLKESKSKDILITKKPRHRFTFIAEGIVKYFFYFFSSYLLPEENARIRLMKAIFYVSGLKSPCQSDWR